MATMKGYGPHKVSGTKHSSSQSKGVKHDQNKVMANPKFNKSAPHKMTGKY